MLIKIIIPPIKVSKVGFSRKKTYAMIAVIGSLEKSIGIIEVISTNETDLVNIKCANVPDTPIITSHIKI